MNISPTDVLAKPVGQKIRPKRNLPALDLATTEVASVRSLRQSSPGRLAGQVVAGQAVCAWGRLRTDRR